MEFAGHFSSQSQLLGCVYIVNLLVDHLWFVMYMYFGEFLNNTRRTVKVCIR